MSDLYRLLLRAIATRGRVAAMGAAGALILLLGFLIRVGEGSAANARELADVGGIALLLPVVAVVFATGVLGDLIDDGTFAYVSLLPVPRWRLATAAWAAAVTAALPLTIVPIVGAVLLGGAGGEHAWAVAAATAAGALAYGALFAGLGVVARRALLWGLVYAVVWEGTLASISEQLAALSVRRYTRGMVGAIVGRPEAVSGTTAGVVLALVVVGGLALTTLALRRRQVP